MPGMRGRTTLVLFLCVFSAHGTSAASLADPDVPEDSANSLNETADDVAKQVMGKECRNGYSPFCLKLGLVRLVGRGAKISLPLLPGVSVSSSGLPSGPHISAADLMEDPDRVDGLLIDRLSDYFGSLSLNVRILDKSAPLEFARAYLGNSAESGRKKDKGGGLAAAGLMSGVMMLKGAMVMLAAMAGKALMASLLALMLAAMSALKGGGEDHKTTYEIVAKPVVSHQHTHSSEVVHGGHHYRRSFEPHTVIYARQIPSL